MASLSFPNMDLQKRVMEALGLKGQFIRRIVIDIKCDDLVHVYVDRFLERSQTDSIFEALASATRDGLVVVEPPVAKDA